MLEMSWTTPHTIQFFLFATCSFTFPFTPPPLGRECPKTISQAGIASRDSPLSSKHVGAIFSTVQLFAKIFSSVQLFAKNILHCATICKKYSSMCNYLQTYKRESGNLHMKQRCYCEFNAERKMIRLPDQNMHEIKSQSIFTPQCNNTSAWNGTYQLKTILAQGCIVLLDYTQLYSNECSSRTAEKR